MATWYGEPISKLVDDQFEIDPKWLPGHEAECDFAKMNSEVLTIIHEEKRFPTKEELVKIRNETMPPQLFSWQELNETRETILSSAKTWNDLFCNEFPLEEEPKQKCWGYISAPYGETVEYPNRMKYEQNFKEPECPWNGITYEDFIKSDPPKTALASTAGLNKHNLNHRLI